MPPVITETIRVSIEFSHTAEISVTTTTISNTYTTTGTIYVPYPWAAHEPVIVAASLALFLYIGSSFGKPTLATIAWLGLLLVGFFSLSGPWWQFIIIQLMAAGVLYWGLKQAKGS